MKCHGNLKWTTDSFPHPYNQDFLNHTKMVPKRHGRTFLWPAFYSKTGINHQAGNGSQNVNCFVHFASWVLSRQSVIIASQSSPRAPPSQEDGRWGTSMGTAIPDLFLHTGSCQGGSFWLLVSISWQTSQTWGDHKLRSFTDGGRLTLNS